MPDTVPPDLFAHAGLVLDAAPVKPAPKRAGRPKAPSPAQRAADVRLEGARRHRPPQEPAGRTRVGQPRDLSPHKVVPFPLSRNAEILSATVEELPHFYDDTFEKKWAKVGRNIERRLVRRGLQPGDALACAHELLDAALDVRATQAEAERRRG